MNPAKPELLSDVEKLLKKKFETDGPSTRRTPSTVSAAKQSARVDQLVLPDEMRGLMPLTKDKYMVRENPHLVAWEREVRKFLRKLTPNHGHRVAAVMVYEWATGIAIKDLMAAGGNANRDLRKINQVLKFYFGDPYMTYIAGRKVPRTYRVKPGTYITRRRPMTLTLYAEWLEGTLKP